ncbi:rCG54307 [Rattus norvegicus]|uniref:RCG54307 n=1 Tax=Rattus norvegicus TaxID=10116 RepID=A6JBE6_RAT|nr:rCG54307 [Rattus norvegicus]
MFYTCVCVCVCVCVRACVCACVHACVCVCDCHDMLAEVRGQLLEPFFFFTHMGSG